MLYQILIQKLLLREAARGTKWQIFVDTVLKEPIPNLYLFGDATPQLCATALSITGRTRFLVLLGRLCFGIFFLLLRY